MKHAGNTSLTDKVEVTGAALVKHLRGIVQPPGKRGSWLRHLNDRQLAEVYHRLKLGQPVYKICKICKEEWNLMPKTEIRSLTRAMTKFRDKAIGEIQTLQDSKEKKVLSKKARRIKKSLDALGSLRWMVDIQAERYALAVEKEKQVGGIQLKETNRTYKELREAVGLLVDAEIRLGVLDSKPAELNVAVKHTFDGVLQHTVGQDGTAMVSATQKFLEDAESMCLTMVLDDDGSFKLKDEEPHKCQMGGEIKEFLDTVPMPEDDEDAS